jgi:hypothetical protein
VIGVNEGKVPRFQAPGNYRTGVGLEQGIATAMASAGVPGIAGIQAPSANDEDDG